MRSIIALLFAIFILLAIWLFTLPVPKAGKLHTKTSPTLPNTTISPSPAATEKNIIVFNPKNLDKISSVLLIKGKARVFENVVSIRLSSLDGKIIFQTTAYAKSPDVGQYGDFEKNISFKTSQEEGILEVYQVSPKDGSEVDKVSIPVLFINN